MSRDQPQPITAHLDRHLGGHGGVDDGGELVGGEDPQRVVPEVQHGDKLQSWTSTVCTFLKVTVAVN